MGQVRKPVVPDGPLRVFFERLHALHSAAGQPSMRELQRRTRSRERPNGINPTTIHDAFCCQRLARWETVQALVGQLGGDVAEFAALWREGRAAEVDMPVDDPQLDWPGVWIDPTDGRPASVPATDRPTPHELPPDVSPFVGRAGPLAELGQLLAGAGEASAAVAISAVSGTAGVGKTALAVHWAHRVADRFPDGHLYMDLRGYDPDAPVPPGEALAAFLRALGVSRKNIPHSVAECAARYRSLLAGRQLLIVLDNARAADHVRPLLPGTPSCFVVITSRDSLAGHVARHGAHRIHRDRLCAADAADLMRALIGARVDAEPSTVEAMVERCARLPLAVRIAAELAVTSTATTLAELAGELADDRRRLDLFDAGDDPRTALRAVFSWSYRILPDDAARLFRLFGLVSGRDLDATAIAALAGLDLDDAVRLSDLLARAHLLERVHPGRFAMHDLLATYAASLAVQHDTAADRRTALARLFDHQGPPLPRMRSSWTGRSTTGQAPAGSR